jgi:hypothetical protein
MGFIFDGFYAMDRFDMFVMDSGALMILPVTKLFFLHLDAI